MILCDCLNQNNIIQISINTKLITILNMILCDCLNQVKQLWKYFKQNFNKIIQKLNIIQFIKLVQRFKIIMNENA